MKSDFSRRRFLAEVGRGMLVASVGYEMAADLGLSSARAEEPASRLTFGELEPLVRLMQDTPVDKLLPKLARQLESGVDLRRLISAGALANARAFGGEDYVGFHTMMALAPALHMAGEMPADRQALPVFKVLYRNTRRIQEREGRQSEVLREVRAAAPSEIGADHQGLRRAIHDRNADAAERIFAALAERSTEEAFDDLLFAVQDATEVHRVVLPYRAWDLLGLIGKEQAHTLLRQSVRYCVKAESWAAESPWKQPRTLLPKMLEEHKLLARAAGTTRADDTWIEAMSRTLFESTPEQAAEAAAAALAEGMAPDDVAQAVTLAANQLVLRDRGRPPREESPGKPVGSVHGDSIGVHACDSANAWRNLARVSTARHKFASLILGAYQVALDRTSRGGDFLNWEALPAAWHSGQIKETHAEDLLGAAEEAIRANLQAQATAIIHRYGELGHEARPVFDLMLRYAVSEDGALHAEKFYRTVTEDFAASRPAFGWRHLLALARVTASEYGRPADGLAEARALLRV